MLKKHRRIISIIVIAIVIAIATSVMLINSIKNIIVVAKEANTAVIVEMPKEFPVMENSVLAIKIKAENVSKKVAKEVAEKKAAEEKAEAERKERERNRWKGQVLTASKGVVQGPSGKETYYNLNMSGVVKIMRQNGFSEKKYPYYVREDGVKMLGPYVMCAANLKIRPRGSLIETTLGTAVVCDTGGFAKHNPRQIDIAVSW